MKKITFLFFLVAFYSGKAQNYNSIVPGRISFFESNFFGTSYVDALKIDSARISGSTVFRYPHRVFLSSEQDAISGCSSVNDTNIFGHVIVERANGNTVFYNRQNDSIVIVCSASLNQAWHLFELGSGNYIEGKVTNVYQQNIFSVPDSFKIITLQAKNSGGTNIFNNFNGDTIILSKNNGIALAYNWFDFPTDATPYILGGLDNPAAGTQNLTAYDIFNFNVGDIFDYEYSYTPLMPTYSSLSWTEATVISKSISVSNDTIINVFDRLFHQKNYTYSPSFDSTITDTHDTVMQKIIVSRCKIVNGFKNRMEKDTSSYSCNMTGIGVMNYQWYRSNEFNGRMQKYISMGYDPFTYPSCPAQYSGDCIFPNYWFGSGIGQTRFNMENSDCGETQLVYFKKGTETWGTAIDSNIFLGISSHLENKISLSIFPNPAKKSINFSFGKTINGKIEIFNSPGEKMTDRKIYGNSLSIDLTENFSAGIYFYRFISAEGKSLTGKFVVE